MAAAPGYSILPLGREICRNQTNHLIKGLSLHFKNDKGVIKTISEPSGYRLFMTDRNRKIEKSYPVNYDMSNEPQEGPKKQIQGKDTDNWVKRPGVVRHPTHNWVK